MGGAERPMIIKLDKGVQIAPFLHFVSRFSAVLILLSNLSEGLLRPETRMKSRKNGNHLSLSKPRGFGFR